MGAGFAVASAAVGRFASRRPTTAFFGGLIGMGAPLVAAAAIATVPPAVAGYAIGGGGNGSTNVAARTLVQLGSPDEIRGRAMSSFGAVAYSAVIVGSLLGGLLVSAFGARVALGVDGAGSLTAGVLGWVVFARRERSANR